MKKTVTHQEIDSYIKQLNKDFMQYEFEYARFCLENNQKPTKQGLNEFQINEAKKYLLKILKPSSIVYTSLKHVSNSGMSRDISVLISTKDGIQCIDFYVSRLLGYSHGKNGGLRVGGCGMDMGYHLIYSLSRALFNNGYKCTGKSCRSNEHSNPPHPEKKKNSMTHSDGGYCLVQQWI